MRTISDLLRAPLDAARPGRPPARVSRISVVLTTVLCRSLPSLSSIRHLRSSVPSARALFAGTVALALTANVASTLATYPHTLSYFNEIAGGPLNGPAHLLDANVDWSQDLLFLKAWCVAHPSARPFHLCWSGFIDPTLAGIDVEPVSRDLTTGACVPAVHSQFEDESIWFARSVNDDHLYRHAGERTERYALFQGYASTPLVAYTIRIYHGVYLRTIRADQHRD